MSQMSAGSKTDVGAYHRDHTAATEQNLGDLAGQFSLQDHRCVVVLCGPWEGVLFVWGPGTIKSVLFSLVNEWRFSRRWHALGPGSFFSLTCA